VSENYFTDAEFYRVVQTSSNSLHVERLVRRMTVKQIESLDSWAIMSSKFACPRISNEYFETLLEHYPYTALITKYACERMSEDQFNSCLLYPWPDIFEYEHIINRLSTIQIEDLLKRLGPLTIPKKVRVLLTPYQISWHKKIRKEQDVRIRRTIHGIL
jgi:hypothetical protein